MPTKRHQRSSSDNPETYAEILTALIESLDETVGGFADRVVESRGTISNAKGKRGPTDPLNKKLAKMFPAWAARLSVAYEAWEAAHPKPARPPVGSLRQQVEKLQGESQHTHVLIAIKDGLKDVKNDGERHWLYKKLAATHLALHHGPAAIEALNNALSCAITSNLVREELATREFLAAMYQHEELFDEAHRILDDGLVRFPDAAILWLRKGHVVWYEDRYSLAYAVLTTARKFGSSQQEVLYSSAQVLTEWGSFDAALTEIKQYLASKAIPSSEGAAIRSARAYIWGQTGELPRALKEFAAIERAQPNTPWLYYRRALCHDTDGNVKAASADLECALTTKGAGLKPGQRHRAAELLRKYKVPVPSYMPPPEFEGRTLNLHL